MIVLAVVMQWRSCLEANNHDVLVAALGLDGEASSVIGVEVLKQKLTEVQFRHWWWLS